MQYRDLIQFDPIQSVIELSKANELSEAKNHIKTYVISDRMAKQLKDLVFPQLQIDRPQDNKGILIVGNYGTGKSHLMSVISSIAEYPELLTDLENEAVRQSAQSIAGRFKVTRVEIGSTTKSLRDILLGEMETALAKWGISYQFPAAHEVTTNKEFIIEAMSELESKYPGQGLLLIVDELLDYLSSRKERDLILDLGFLREIGEVSGSTTFRFLGGLQESLFDNPQFAFVGQRLRRVRDRFEQVRIAREDIAYVVSHRLLRKTDTQLAQITEHLRQFTPLYGQLAERLEEYALMFPIHPAYIETFERVYVAEKREVLKTFSLAIQAKLEDEVPSAQPGLIAYDHYWNVLRDNPSMRSLENVSEVVERSNVLESRINNAFERKYQYLLPMATRIIHALSVQRLTTENIRTAIGPTAEELRDNLCLYTAIPEQTAEFLLGQVNIALKQIMRTVSGQFISYNEENGQYYLDVDKVIDFDAKISQRGSLMGNDELNRYFFDALAQTLNFHNITTYVPNFRIWLHQIPWLNHQVTRPGYFFFGKPNDRSTAQPPRDFYVYILPPFGEQKWEDEERSDEVIFNLTGLGDEFKEMVRTYAGARAMSTESVDHQRAYADKADTHLGLLNRWLRDRLGNHLQVIHEGDAQLVRAILPATRSSASQTLDELIDLVSAHLLEPEFNDQYPDYPAFTRATQPITEEARPVNAMEAVRYLAGRGGRTRMVTTVLEGLNLVDEAGMVRPYDSAYASYFLKLLQNKADVNQVVNRGELITTVAGGVEAPIEKDLQFNLEPEWIVVVLLALVHHGDMVLNVDGRENLDAGSLERAATLTIDQLTGFRHYKRPKGVPIEVWVMVFETLGLSPGLIRVEADRGQAVQELSRTVNAELEHIVTLQGQLQQGGLRLWNVPLFTDNYSIEIQGGTVVGTDQPNVTLSQTELIPHFRRYKSFLETLNRFDSVGKLANLKLRLLDVKEAGEDKVVIARAEKLLNLVNQLQSLTTYLAAAEGQLPDNHPWSELAIEKRRQLIDNVRSFGRGDVELNATTQRQELEQLKKDYIEAYSLLHRQMVLGPAGIEQKHRLLQDDRLAVLEKLGAIDLLSRDELETWRNGVQGLKENGDFHEGVLQDSPTAAGFRPIVYRDQTFNATDKLEQHEVQLGDILQRWQQALVNGLQSDTAQQSIASMTPQEQALIQQFLSQGDGDLTVPNGFPGAANRALQGIDALTIQVEALVNALKQGGLPCTPQQLEKRFQAFVEQTMRGHDARNTRLTLDQ